MSVRRVKIIVKKWPVAGVFRISRSALTEIVTIIVEISENGVTGRGECRPYARYEETPNSVAELIGSISSELENGLSIEDLQSHLPAGAARNAIDCALWDLESKLQRRPVWDLLGLPSPSMRETAYTISIDTIDAMVGNAIDAAAYKLLKIKIGEQGGLEASLAILDARPDARLIVDANESLNPNALGSALETLNHPRIALIEQPIAAGSDDNLGINPSAYRPICADESVHSVEELDHLWNAGYRAVNVKLDKTGGLTAAKQVMVEACSRGFIVMAGCMAASSLAMAPMMYLESLADFLDLDGPLLLSEDVENGIDYRDGNINPPSSELWGYQDPASV